MEPGRTVTRSHTVTVNDTALAVGSGSLPVLGTPRLLAWCEGATCDALDLPDGSTSVGVAVALDHLAASRVGREVDVVATVADVDGRRVRFEVTARHTDTDEVLARGTVERVVVDVDRFLARL